MMIYTHSDHIIRELRLHLE